MSALKPKHTPFALLILLALPTLMPAADSAPADFATSTWLHPGPDGKLVYKTTPVGDRIMDFSYAGYRGGGVALPSVPVKKTVQPSGKDDTASIQAAIDEVAALPLVGGSRGAVLLAPGEFSCSSTITISSSGVVLRGSGSGSHSSGSQKDPQVSTIKLAGKPHLAISVRAKGGRDAAGADDEADKSAAAKSDPTSSKSGTTSLADAYVPSGTKVFTVADATGFAVGDWIVIRRPVTAAWVKFMGMDDMVRDGKPETWLKVGSTTNAERKIAAIDGKTITVDVPLSDSFDSKFTNPPGTMVAKIKPPTEVSQVGIESLHIESPPQEINHTMPHFQALRMSGQDCWARDVVIDETMNSVSVTGRRITLQQISVNRKAKHQGSSKPAEFTPNGTQVLLDRCSVTGDNVWFAATGAGVSGPIVLLNCTFQGNGRAESHDAWSTGMLYDNCTVPGGGIDLKNRGEMGSGHGWTLGWGVAWNCQAKDYVVQNPPGAVNWLIGCTGKTLQAARPFAKTPNLPEGIIESPGKPVGPRSLYLAQLAERLGPDAVKNLGY